MASRRAADVVCFVLRAVFAHGAVEIGCTESGNDRPPAAQQSAQQVAGQVRQTQTAAKPQEFDTAGGDFLHALVVDLLSTLPQQALGNINLAEEPGRVEHSQVESVDGRLETLLQGIAGEKHSHRAAALE